jgi:hypothetical protein
MKDIQESFVHEVLLQVSNDAVLARAVRRAAAAGGLVAVIDLIDEARGDAVEHTIYDMSRVISHAATWAMPESATRAAARRLYEWATAEDESRVGNA